MAVYVVTWNLNREDSNYDAKRRAFVAVLDSYETIRDGGLESVRFVSSNQTAEQISAKLKTPIDANDRLLVSCMNSGQHQGWLSKEVWDWINARL